MNKMVPVFLCLAVLCQDGAFAQGLGEIEGKLLDEAHDPIPGASISAASGGRAYLTTTDADGRFLFKALPAGDYEVRFVAMNVDRTVVGVQVSPDHTTRMATVSIADARELGKVVVERSKWEPPLIDAHDPGVTRVFHKQFEHSAAVKSPVQLIANHAPGVYKAANGDGLFFRGARSENMCYFVDGIKLGSRLNGLPSAAINSFDVYTGGLPAKYGDVTGGVVAIETKSYFDLYQQRNAGIR